MFISQKSCTLLLCLLGRCDHLSDEISIANLQLFEMILMKNDQLALDELVINYLNDRGYHVSNPGMLMSCCSLHFNPWYQCNFYSLHKYSCAYKLKVISSYKLTQMSWNGTWNLDLKSLHQRPLKEMSMEFAVQVKVIHIVS